MWAIAKKWRVRTDSSMHKLRSVEIIGFRGLPKGIKLNLDEQANFIIGRNGTGKTTLINIIHSILAVDVAALEAAPFVSAILKFKRSGERKVPTLVVHKLDKSRSGFSVEYSIQVDRDVEAFRFQLSPPKPSLYLGDLFSRANESSGDRDDVRIRNLLDGIYKITWLSLQRAKKVASDGLGLLGSEASVPDVDKRLDAVSNDLVKYFTRLDKRVSDQTQAFQKDWFLSSLATGKSFTAAAINKLSSYDDRDALISIFERFGLNSTEYRSKIDAHFSITKQAIERLVRDNKGTASEYMAAFDALRLHSHVEKWQTLQDSQKEVYSPKTLFIQVLENMLYKKSIVINSSNQIFAVARGREKDLIQLKYLSSGEKQLVIFLSETLLQEQEPFIFLADEPELSLHVEWQEELVPNILKINPNAQIIFATHSPDVVNVYQNNIIKMEEIVS